MARKTVMYHEIMSWKPCHSTYKCMELLQGRKRWKIVDLLQAEHIKAEDRLWVVLRPELIGERLCHEFAIYCAESVLHLFEAKYPDDPRPRKAIETKRLWLDGEISDEELRAARAGAERAAWGAAWGAARTAAWTAARTAAWTGTAWTGAARTARAAAQAAARAGAWTAARGAARTAAWVGARTAAWVGARVAQIEWLISKIFVETTT